MIFEHQSEKSALLAEKRWDKMNIVDLFKNVFKHFTLPFICSCIVNDFISNTGSRGHSQYHETFHRLRTLEIHARGGK